MSERDDAAVERLYPDGDAVRQCARCHCSVPLDEWEVVGAATALRHKGPMRDHHEERFVEPDENGDDECGWIMPIKQRR